MTYKDAARKLRKLGCHQLRRRGPGSHRKWHNPANGRLTSLPDWGPKSLKTGTLRAVVRQLGLNWQSFLGA